MSKLEKASSGMPESRNKIRTLFMYRNNVDTTLIIADRHHCFNNNDTLFLTLNDLSLVKFYFPKCNFLVEDYLLTANYIKSIAKFSRIDIDEFYYSPGAFPETATGEDLVHILNKLDSKYYFSNYHEKKQGDSLKYYSFHFNGFLDSNGKFELNELNIDNFFIKQNFKKYIESIKFNRKTFPLGISKCPYEKTLFYRNRDSYQAKNEKLRFDSVQLERYNKIKTASSIDGVYIPKDIEEVNKYLDSLLPKWIIKEIVSLPQNGNYSYLQEYFENCTNKLWHLNNHSRLYWYFSNSGLTSLWDMQELIVKSYFNYKHKLPFILEEEIFNINERNKHFIED